jgi:hypothetical protein
VDWPTQGIARIAQLAAQEHLPPHLTLSLALYARDFSHFPPSWAFLRV